MPTPARIARPMAALESGLRDLVEAVEQGQGLIQKILDLGHLAVARVHVLHGRELADLRSTRPPDEAHEPGAFHG